MSIEKKRVPPPGIPASKKNEDEAYKETHRYVEEGRYFEDAVEEAREEIAERYQIPIENIAVHPEIKGRKREIRLFMILENLKTGERFYADGHVPHAIILNYIFQKFPKIGIKNRFNLPLNWEENWKTIKGFIDPYMNGFRDFPTTRSAIIKAMDENDQNGLSESQVVELKKDPKNGDIELPNWVKSI